MMATITNAETLEARTNGGTTRFLFRFTLDTGEVHLRRAWVPSSTDETQERTRRGNMLLDELAEAEINGELG